MTRRLAVSAILAPAGIYQREAREASGYRPSASSRFAVVRMNDSDVWRLTHLQSGASVDSILPAMPRRLTMTDKLAVAAAFETLTHCDWSAFDALPAVTLETTEAPALAPSPSLRVTTDEMRRVARVALGA